MRAGTLLGRAAATLGLGPSREPSRGYRVARLEQAELLAPAWDDLATSLFQRRAFLSYIEAQAPCDMRYYELRDEAGTLCAGAVVCTIQIDLLTYSRIRSPMRLAMICIPCDQSAPGLLGAAGPARALASRLLLEEPRFLVGLNLDAPLGLAQFVEGRNLPGLVLRRRFDSYADYLASLRAPYRRRLHRIGERFADVKAEASSCDRLDDEMYRLYLQVYQRSDEKLRRLPQSFLRELPEPFTLTCYRRGKRLLGWHITVADADRFTFFLEGHVDEPDVYFNLLLGVLRQGIEAGCSEIDLGQTAEVPKTRLGAELDEKIMLASHPHIAVRTLVQLGKRALSYQRRVPEVHVFRAP